MTNNIYTLESISLNEVHNFIADCKFSPVIMILCAVVYAFSVSLSYSVNALFFASLLPLILLFRNKFIFSQLAKLNILNLIMILTIALTWPDFKSGLITGIIISFRVNMIYIIFAAIIFPMGYAKIYEALNIMNVPEKLRVLLVLTLRGIFILHERLDAALISIKLRAPNLRGVAKFRMFAYIIACVLIQGSQRSERIMRAVECRGGFKGFMQSDNEKLKIHDIIFFASFMIYSAAIIFINYA